MKNMAEEEGFVRPQPICKIGIKRSIFEAAIARNEPGGSAFRIIRMDDSFALDRLESVRALVGHPVDQNFR